MKRIPLVVDAQIVEQLRISLQTKVGLKISKKKLIEKSVAILWEQIAKKGSTFLFESGLIENKQSKRNATI